MVRYRAARLALKVLLGCAHFVGGGAKGVLQFLHVEAAANGTYAHRIVPCGLEGRPCGLVDHLAFQPEHPGGAGFGHEGFRLLGERLSTVVDVGGHAVASAFKLNGHFAVCGDMGVAGGGVEAGDFGGVFGGVHGVSVGGVVHRLGASKI